MKYLSLSNNDWFDQFDRIFEPLMKGGNYQGNMLKTDISDEGDHYLLEMEAAGIPKECIGIELENGYLNVSVNRKESTTKKDGYIRKERREYSCSRSFYVGDVTEQDISADYVNGILCIKVKKEENKLPKSTQIKIGAGD